MALHEQCLSRHTADQATEQDPPLTYDTLQAPLLRSGWSVCTIDW